MKPLRKKDFPVSEARRFLEPGPVVLVSSRWKGNNNIMTLGWHTCMEFTPSLVGCVIGEASHSFPMIKKSGECVINVPTAAMAKQVVGIGNCSGADVDKFKKFKLTPVAAKKVKAPLVAECFVNLECKLYDTTLVNKYNFFIFKIVKAHAATGLKTPRTLHYQGEGAFMVAGKTIKLRSKL